jgi:predicted flap endonuclease-1-like 5' DNA nuclease
MATNLLWFVMAGFLLGFATSTLWEWFYFRKERLKLTDRRIRELEAKLREAEPETDTLSPINTPPTSAIPTVASVTAGSRTSAWDDTSYRSPGVFLESEDYDADGSEKGAAGRERPRTPLIGTSAATPPTSSNPLDSVIVPRNDSPTPADALRAKRNASPRSRQEVLAALRRNSEAVQRGEQLPSAESAPPLPEPPSPFARRESTLVTPSVSQEPAPPAAPATPAKEIPARQRWINNPELTQRTKEYPDDLSKIKGIGDVYKQRLYRAGIYTWKQIAEADVETLRRATSAYPSSNVDEWLVQAEKLMEKNGRKDAIYSGPQPDDMTKILGIGPVGASVLYRAGICTYEQLASTSISDLEALFPVAVAGDQPDFLEWVARATLLADEKHRE